MSCVGILRNALNPVGVFSKNIQTLSVTTASASFEAQTPRYFENHWQKMRFELRGQVKKQKTVFS